MKIAFVIYDLGKGGAERVVSTLSQYMAKDHRVKIILFNQRIEYTAGGEVICLRLPAVSNPIFKLFNMLRRRNKLRRIFKKERFDRIFSFMESANFPAILADRKTIASVRISTGNFSRMRKFFAKILYPRCRKVVAVSRALQDELLRLGVKNTEVIYNPVPLAQIKKLAKESIDLQKSFIVGMGRATVQKGFDKLLQAFAQTKTAQQAELVILGDGPDLAALKDLVQRLQLTGRVYFMGTVDNPYKYLSRAKLFVLSSRMEGFPNALVEAMACNTAVIATDCPTGPSEIIQHGENGILVGVDQVKAMAGAIDQLFCDDQLRDRLAQNGMQSVTRFSPEKIIQQWLSLH